MGALHEGHLSLVRTAKAKADVVAVSIFVNPTQFGPTEDFTRYPRDLEKDCGLLEREGVDVVFAPSAQGMYPEKSALLPTPGGSEAASHTEPTTWVTVEALSDRLCGKSRPGHFRGVATVVAKLFNIVEPDVAFFGQKDAAQVAVIKRMVRDLNMSVPTNAKWRWCCMRLCNAHKKSSMTVSATQLRSPTRPRRPSSGSRR